MSHKVGKNDIQIQELEKRLQILEQKLYLSTDSDEIISIQIEKNALVREWNQLIFHKAVLKS